MDNMQLIPDIAFDVYSRNKFNHNIKVEQNNELREVAKQLESTFIQMMLKSMRNATSQSDLFSNEQTRMLTSMYDQQIAQDLSQRGLGFGDMIYQQLSSRQPDIISATEQLNTYPLDYKCEGSLYSQSSELIKKDIVPLEKAVSKTFQKFKALSRDNQKFISQLIEPTKIASKNSGISLILILAQAALESGWGRRKIVTSEGKNSHNLFGVKAGKSWKGSVTNITTTEVIDGKETKIRDNFRVYHSYEEAIADYINLLTKNPRYQDVKQTTEPEIAAKYLHRAGYATDLNYSSKLINLINQIRSHLINKTDIRELPPYTTDLKDIF